jgi:uncharacterized membrane protein YgcG
MMKNTAKLLLMMSLFVSLSAFAAAPRFAGEIWAGSDVIPESGPVNVYWVFDSGSFHEYVYYLRTDEMRLLTTGRYQVSPSKDGAELYELQFARMTDGEGPGKMQIRTRVQLTRTAGAMTFPAGDRLTRIDGFTQFVPPIERASRMVGALGTLKPQPNLMYAGCCSDCFAVHDFLGISWLNGICCSGGCFSGGGGGFGGGGATGGW